MRLGKLLTAFYIFSAAIAGALVISACAGIEGSGSVITEDIQVSDFDSIELNGSGEVVITQSGSESLSIETDDNIMEHIEAEVDGRTLKLGFKSGIRSISPTRLTFHVNVDDLSSLAISGSGQIDAESLRSDNLSVEVSGSGDVNITGLSLQSASVDISGSGEVDLAGEVQDQEVSISGSGKYRAGDMASKTAEISISGSGDATIWARETLEADISGSGSVDYYGRPSINMSGSGSGKVNGLGEK